MSESGLTSWPIFSVVTIARQQEKRQKRKYGEMSAVSYLPPAAFLRAAVRGLSGSPMEAENPWRCRKLSVVAWWFPPTQLALLLLKVVFRGFDRHSSLRYRSDGSAEPRSFAMRPGRLPLCSSISWVEKARRLGSTAGSR